MTMSRMRLALLGSGAAIALLAAPVPVSASQIDELRSQLQGLKDKMSRLENMRDRNRRAAPAAAVESGAKPRSWKLPGSNTSMQIGGYAKLDLIYDINSAAGDLVGNVVARDGTGFANQQGNFRLHARQSRFWIRTWTPTDWGELETRIEADFFGTGGNQMISNSNSLRLRHAYGRLGPVLAGQTWSSFMALHALPETLEFGGPSGQIYIRQAQLRYTHSFGNGTALVLSVENPETRVPFNATAGQFNAGGGLATPPDRLPDFVVKLRHRWSAGTISFAALFRELSIDDGVSTSYSTLGWGLRFGFSYRFNAKKTSVGMLAYYGQGIGRYTLRDVGFFGSRETVLNGPLSPTSGTLDAIEKAGGLIWIRHRWTDTLRSNVVYGRDWNNVVGATTFGNSFVNFGLAGKAALTQTVVQESWSAHANLIWSPVPGVDIGVEYVYAFFGVINAGNAKVHRIQASFKYRF